MTPKFFATTTLTLTSFTLLSAQAPVNALRYAGIQESNVSGLVAQLEQSALQLLLSAVVIMGIIWIGYIVSECSRLNTNIKSKRHISCLLPLAMVAVMSLLGSSCSVERMVQAAETQKGKAAEGGMCICHTPNNRLNYGGIGQYNLQSPYDNYTPNASSPYCKQCGLRRYNRNR